MNAMQIEQFEQFADQFLEDESFLPYFTPRNYSLVVQRAKERIEAAGGYPSYAALELAAADLIGANIIRKQYEPSAEDEAVRAASQPVQPIALTLREYQSLPVSVVQRRYRNEPAFAAACDALFATGQV